MRLLLILLTGCGTVTGGWYDSHIRDLDGDGLLAERFGGDDCDDNDASIALCDGDSDGFDGVAAGGTDCDDDNALVNPGASERCNGVDDDCDGLLDAADEDTVDARRFYDDLDEDGFGGGPGHLSCELDTSGFSLLNTDCDDTAASVNPEATEFCDAVDQDCDGETHDLESIDAVAGRVVDADSDGYTSGMPLGPGCVLSGELSATEAPAELDCDDTDASIHPFAAEIFYDDIDQACDGPQNDRDSDQDGSPVEADCDDTDPLVYPGAVELCDGVDNDCNGIVDSDDPNIADPTLLFHRDGDGDGFGTPTQTRGFCAGDDSEGWVAASALEDCNDTIASVNPFASETCNGLDDDCNGLTDDNASDTVLAFLDQDGDGFGSVQQQVCPGSPGVAFQDGDCNDHPVDGADIYPGAPEICGDGVSQDCLLPVGDLDCDRDGQDGIAAGGNDCDDGDPEVFTGAEEVCDGKDNDCDGTADEGAADALHLFVDGDGDGYGGAAVTSCAEPGLVEASGDCDDLSQDIFPGAFEVCGDGVLQDCAAPARQFDCDQDGAEDEAFGGHDCDDTNSDVGPEAQEICDNLDNDCDELVDGADDSLDLSTIREWFQDLDGDGFGSHVVVASAECSGPSDSVPNEDDCNDDDATIAPGLPELCDGLDNDCDTETDEGNPIDAPVFHLDNDEDGFGGPTVSNSSCEPPAEGTWLLDGSDCNDVFDNVFPGAVETCDGLDNDCDGALDDADQSGLADFLAWYRDDDGDLYGQTGQVIFQCAQPAGYSSISGDCDDANADVQIDRTWYRDLDGDGFGSDDFTEQCGEPVGYVLIDGDCNDAEPQISPATPEVCDGVDNDCDGDVDDDDSLVAGAPAWYADEDRDQWGLAYVGNTCLQPPGASIFPGDCDDQNASIRPSAIELCDGDDNDCDGLTDDDDPGAVGKLQWYEDLDLDGYFGTSSVVACSAEGSTTADDCDDELHTVNPGEPEICNGIDDDCNSAVDLDDANVTDAIDVWTDADGDAYGVIPTRACAVESGFAEQGGDCDDQEEHSFPGNPEICDGLDNDCNGPADDGLTHTYYFDDDGDGFVDAEVSHELVTCEAPPPHWLPEGGYDCDTNDSSVYPGAPEACDGTDSNCDGVYDTELQDPIYWDFDNDGIGSSSAGMACTHDLGSNQVLLPGDCDDGDSNVGVLTWYTDGDGDGAGVPGGVEQCTQPAATADNPYDCDDTDPFIQQATQYWWDGDEDTYGDPAVEHRFCDTPADARWLRNQDDCAPHASHVPSPHNAFTVGPAADFSTLQEAVDVACGLNSYQIDLHLLDATFSGAVLPNGKGIRITGLGPELTVIEGQLSGNVIHIEGLTLRGPRPLLSSHDFSFEMLDVSLEPHAGTGVAVRLTDGASFNHSVMHLSGGTAFELDYAQFDGFQLNSSSVIAVGPTSQLLLSQEGTAYVQLADSIVGGAWLSLGSDSLNLSVGGATVVMPGVLTSGGDLNTSSSVISTGAGTCASATSGAFSNEPSCSSTPGSLGIQTWHPDLDPTLWDFHHNVDSDAYLAGSGARLADYTLNAAGLPAYWLALHHVTCDVGDEDVDADNLTCLEEYAQGTSPSMQDTDNDGVHDDLDSAPLDPHTP